MVPNRKPLKRVALILGLLLSAQFCCCIIPIRWRVNLPAPGGNGEQTASQPSLAAWSESAAGRLHLLWENFSLPLAEILPERVGPEANFR